MTTRLGIIPIVIIESVAILPLQVLTDESFVHKRANNELVLVFKNVCQCVISEYTLKFVEVQH